MHRTSTNRRNHGWQRHLAAPILGLGLIGGWPLSAAAWQEAPQPAAAAADGKQATNKLPLKKIVLFNSGVGFYQHDGQISGDATVELKFNVDDVNDLLKSMVLQDLGGGQVSTVTYASKDPITRTLKTFAIDLTESPTIAGLLSQVRGERVELTPQVGELVTGTILGIEQRTQPPTEKGEVHTNDFVNLVTDEGLRSFMLNDISRFKLLDPKLNAELNQALATLAMSHATDKKSVTLKFTGEGARDVRVGYVQESPIWKTSYRLVLDDQDAPFLQGWAIVENTTEEDWSDVNLTLVNGRPISFQMNLYDPLYVSRPTVEPELFASLRPQRYGQDLAEKQAEFAAAAAEPVADPTQLARRAGNFGRARGGEAAKQLRLEAAPGVIIQEEEERLTFGVPVNSDQGALYSTAQSAAQASELGELFQYAIERPVTLPRQQSAMLPIVNDSVQVEKLSIYNASVHPKHPLNGLRLTNSTGLHLMQGPITVFDDNAYVGDAQIEDLPPGGERLVSYAMDLDIEIAPESRGLPETLTNVKLNKGALETTRKHVREMVYTIKNSGDAARQVLVEHPLDSSWKLVKPAEPAEKTRNLYRFAVTAEPGKPAVLTVVEEQVVSQSIGVANIDDNMLLHYIRQGAAVSDEVKQALRQVRERNSAIAQVQQQKQELEAQVATISQEQERIRQNMAQLDRNTELYNRYVKKFGEQEDSVEKLQQQIRKLTADITRLQQERDTFIQGLTI